MFVIGQLAKFAHIFAITTKNFSHVIILESKKRIFSPFKIIFGKQLNMAASIRTLLNLPPRGHETCIRSQSAVHCLCEQNPSCTSLESAK